MTNQASENSHQIIAQNLKIISGFCNACTIGISMYLVFKLFGDIKSSLSNQSQRKIPLLKWSMAFICSFALNTLIIIFVPFIPKIYPICDFLMQLAITASVLFYFKWWESNMRLMIRNRFALMLTIKSSNNRLTFMARIMNLASKYSISQFLLIPFPTLQSKLLRTLVIRNSQTNSSLIVKRGSIKSTRKVMTLVWSRSKNLSR